MTISDSSPPSPRSERAESFDQITRPDKSNRSLVTPIKNMAIGRNGALPEISPSLRQADASVCMYVYLNLKIF